MSARPELVALAAELRAHLARVRTVVDRCQVLAAAGGEELAVVWAVAGHLHSFYTGCEAILSRAVRGFEGEPAPGPRSHRVLLDRASLDLPLVRPPIVRVSTANVLEPYRAFRHFFRHAYGAELDWLLMAPKVAQVGSVFEGFSQDIDAFCTFLSHTAEAQGLAIAGADQTARRSGDEGSAVLGLCGVERVEFLLSLARIGVSMTNLRPEDAHDEARFAQRP